MSERARCRESEKDLKRERGREREINIEEREGKWDEEMQREMQTQRGRWRRGGARRQGRE